MFIRLNGGLNPLFRIGSSILKNQLIRMSSVNSLSTVKRTTRSGVKRKNDGNDEQNSKAKLAVIDSDHSSINEISEKIVKKQKKSTKKASKAVVPKKESADDSDDSHRSPEKPKKVVKKSAKSSKKSVKLTDQESDNKEAVKVKNQLEIPEIVIPKNTETVPRIEGPSSWNGTVSYTNQIYLGAHISAAGWRTNLYQIL